MDETIDCDVVGLLVRRLPHFSHMKTPEQPEMLDLDEWEDLQARTGCPS